jgi:hypothetical protein
MLIFVLRRLLLIIPMALLVVTLTWGLIRVAPGTFYSQEKPLPPAIEAIIMRCFERDPNLRFENARVLGSALLRAMPTLMVNTPEPITIPMLKPVPEPTQVPWFVLATVAMAMFICFFVAAQESKVQRVHATPATRVVEAPRTLETSSASIARLRPSEERPAKARTVRRAARVSSPPSTPSSSSSAFM